jgi:DNA-binding response OmpR family regulator
VVSLKKKVLIVEDDPQISRVLNLELSHAGFETQTASDGEMAVEMAKRIFSALFIA